MRLIVLFAVAACGRLDFDPRGGAGGGPGDANGPGGGTDGGDRGDGAGAGVLDAAQLARDATADVMVTSGGAVRNVATMRWVLTFTVVDISALPLPAPISLVADDLSSNATVYEPTGTTALLLPAGSAYVDGPDDIEPSGQEQIIVEFLDPSDGFIDLTPRVLVGPGSR